jgi:hypothetical protein
MSSAQFQIDKIRGDEGQSYVRDMLRSWHLEVEEAPDKWFPDWDLKTPSKTIEVKTDLKASLTGNICLELEALDHSKADLLAIITENPRTVYFKELPVVRDFAHQWHKTVRGGEFAGQLALVPRSIFIDRLKPQILTAHPVEEKETSSV